MDKRLLITFVVLAGLGFLFLLYTNQQQPEYKPTDGAQAGGPEAAGGGPSDLPGTSPALRRALEELHPLVSGRDDEGFEAKLSNLGGTFRSVEMRRAQYDQLPNDERSSPLAEPLKGEIPERYYEAGPLELVTTWDPAAYPFQTVFDSFEHPGTVQRVVRPPVEGGRIDPAHPDRLLPPEAGPDFRSTYPAVVAGDRIEVSAPPALARTYAVKEINQDGSATVEPPFTVSAAVANVAYRVTVEGPFEAIYRRDRRFALVEQDAEHVTYAWPDPRTDRSDVWLERRFTVQGPYAVDLTVRLHNLSGEPVKSQPSLVVTGFQPPVEGGGMFSGPPPDLREAACRAGGDVTRATAQAILEKPQDPEWSPPGMVEWVGIDSRYFLLAAIPTNVKTSQCVLVAARTAPPLAALRASVGLTKTWVLAGSKSPCRPAWLTAGELPVCSEQQPGSSGYLNYRLYIGPKDLEHLRAVGGEGVDPKLEESVDFWVVGFLAQPMVWLLKVFHDLIPHWGVAIVLLTILVKLLLLPLTHKSFMSMQGMQKLKPEMELLKTKYGNDKQKLNEEMMALYKRHKVNPLGGCLPMVVQIPVFFGLYKALLYAIELRHSPLFWWIQDLSAKDPYYITPLVMGATMFVQQKMTPTGADPMQAKIMLFMPIIFTFMFLNFPSGLVIYWLFNNIISIGQQVYINKKPS